MLDMDDKDQASDINLLVPANSFLTQNPDIDFRETSFFQNSTGRNHELPSTFEVDEREAKSPGRGVTIFEEMDLVVKSGHRQHGRLEEALTMRALRKAFPNGEVPVPEVFGWRTIGDSEYIYMSLVPGVRLFDAWDSIPAEDKSSVCDQLEKIQMELQKLKHPSGTFIGKQISHKRPRLDLQLIFCWHPTQDPSLEAYFTIAISPATQGLHQQDRLRAPRISTTISSSHRSHGSQWLKGILKTPIGLICLTMLQYVSPTETYIWETSWSQTIRRSRAG